MKSSWIAFKMSCAKFEVHTSTYYKNVLRTLSLKIYCAVFSLSKDFIFVIKYAIKYSFLRSHGEKSLRWMQYLLSPQLWPRNKLNYNQLKSIKAKQWKSWKSPRDQRYSTSVQTGNFQVSDIIHTRVITILLK